MFSPLVIVMRVSLFKDNEPVAESTANQSNLRVRLSCSFRDGGVEQMINEVDEGLARTKINEPDITSLTNRQP